MSIFWPAENKSYEGTVQSYDTENETHVVHYDDGDVCAEDFTDLSKQWKIIECFWPTSRFF